MKCPVVLVIRRDDLFSSTLRERGFTVLNLELIGTEPAATSHELDKRLACLNDYDGIFLTSPIAAEIFVDRLRENETSFQGKVYALGERTRALIRDAGLNVAFCEEANTVAELIEAFDAAEFEGKNFLFIRGSKSMRIVPEMVGGVAEVDEVEVYRTVDMPVEEEAIGDVRERLERSEIDWICFFSPSGVARFAELFEAKNIKAAAIGKTTAAAAREAGLNVNLVSPRAGATEFASSLLKLNGQEN